MADRNDNPLKSQAEVDLEAIRRFNRLEKESLDREKRLTRHYKWRGNKLQPMSIEPFPFERQRLSGMTDADRALRKQWVHDQILAPNEPRYVPELFPKNPIRKMLGAPWNALFRVLRPIIVSIPSGER